MTRRQGSRNCLARKAAWLIPLLLMVLGTLLACSHPVTAARPELSCRENDLLNLTIETDDGNIVATIRPGAAPNAVSRVIALANTSAAEGLSYQNLPFGYVHPHVEIRTTGGTTEGLPTEIDAQSLGLDTTLIQASNAYAVLRWEVLEHYTAHKKNKGVLHPDIIDWAAQWRETNRPDFLVGVSRQRVNEALGFRYTSDLKSMPVEVGSLVLVPSEQRNVTSLNLSIILDKQLARRTGRWVTIGKVTQGLDVARQISLGERYDDRGRRRTPRKPVTINNTFVRCIEE